MLSFNVTTDYLFKFTWNSFLIKIDHQPEIIIEVCFQIMMIKMLGMCRLFYNIDCKSSLQAVLFYYVFIAQVLLIYYTVD